VERVNAAEGQICSPRPVQCERLAPSEEQRPSAQDVGKEKIENNFSWRQIYSRDCSKNWLRALHDGARTHRALAKRFTQFVYKTLSCERSRIRGPSVTTLFPKELGTTVWQRAATAAGPDTTPLSYVRVK